MNVDKSVQIDEALQRLIERVAKSNGMTPDQVVRQAITEYSETHQAGLPSQPDGNSLFDRASRVGLIGCFGGLPTDLSLNPFHMEGFGCAEN